MGSACASKFDVVQMCHEQDRHGQDPHNVGRKEQNEEALSNQKNIVIEKCKKVIDSLNAEIKVLNYESNGFNQTKYNLERELMDLKEQILREKQKKREETNKLKAAQEQINKIEAEKAELRQKILEISVINGKSLELEANRKHENGSNLAYHPFIAIDAKQEKPAFGHCQSPINIMSTTENGTTSIMTDQDFERNPLQINYPPKVTNCTILNNGDTVQININPSNKCTLSINNKLYSLKHFYFHTPSEHTIDSKQYEMEMHLVHTNQDNEIAVLGFIFTTKQRYQKPKLQLTKSRMHLVLSAEKKKAKSMLVQTTDDDKRYNTLKIMSESDEESDDTETDDEWDVDEDGDKMDINGDTKNGNDFLAQFWNELPLKKTIDDIPLSKPISFDYLFETSSNNFIKNIKTNSINIDMALFEYTGSLTTPPYTEGVQWLISKTTQFINNEQLKKLRGCWRNQNNARAVQQYFGRTVSLRSQSSLTVMT